MEALTSAERAVNREYIFSKLIFIYMKWENVFDELFTMRIEAEKRHYDWNIGSIQKTNSRKRLIEIMTNHQLRVEGVEGNAIINIFDNSKMNGNIHRKLIVYI